MKGLLLKDILNLKQQAKIYLLIILVWMALAFTGSGASFFSGVIAMFSVLIPVSAIAYDEKAKWERYALTMPISRLDLVLSKYLLTFFCAAVGTVFAIVVSLTMTKDIKESFGTPLITMSIGIIFACVILPIIFRFGVEKGRMLMMVVLLTPMLSTMLLSKINISFPSEATIEKLLYFLPVIMLLVIIGSILISKRVYERKEF